MSKQNISGIYAITNKINGKRYIGSSKSVYYRWSQNHLPTLRHGNHHNRHLQAAWNKYGEDNFELQLIEECGEDELFKREGFWIEERRSWEREFGYNLTRIVDEKQVFSDESKLLMSESTQQSKLSDYWQTGTNGEILKLYQEGASKNAIAKQLGITRSAVYSCLEQNGLHENTGQGAVVKLTEEMKQKVKELRDKGLSWEEISEQTGVSRTQLDRVLDIWDGKYGSNKVNRETYRTVTSNVVAKVETLRSEGKKWEEIEQIVGVSRFALHQHGITVTLKLSRKGETRRKLTDEDRRAIHKLLDEGRSITEIYGVVGIAKSTIRLERKRYEESLVAI